MPQVHVTNYELDRDLLPHVCVRCGAPAADRVVQTLYIIDGWQGAFQLIGLLFGLFFFPPLVLFVMGYVQQASARLPLCPPHRDDFLWRQSWGLRVVLPVWTAAALIADGLIVADFLIGEPGVLCFAPLVVLLGGILGSAAAHRGRIGIERLNKNGLRFSGVSEEFAAALAEERARDRVDNPDRRGGHGDVRDDYDDRVV